MMAGVRFGGAVALASWGMSAWASDPTETRRHDRADVEPAPSPPAPGLSFLGVAQVRVAITDVVTTNPLLDGQIVGALGGANGTTTAAGRPAWYTEQRVNGFLTYRPNLWDGRLALTAGFEIDFGFGDAAYGNAPNKGGGFGADQVNLQTRRLHVDLRAIDKPRHTLDVRVGLQMVTDGARDPVSARRDDLFRTGGGLRFFGSEGTGLTAYGVVRDAEGVRLRYKAGAYTLWEFKSGAPDDVTLFQGDVEWLPSWRTRLGAHVWYVADASDGDQGVLGVGPASDLASLQGAAVVPTPSAGEPPPVDADIAWIGVDGGLDHDLSKGRFGANGGIFLNVGRVRVGSELRPVLGTFATGEVRYRYARGAGSVARLGVDYASGDDPNTLGFRSVITGNSWGIAGAVSGAHGTVLLFSDPGAINRQAAVVYDLGAQGRGLISAQGTVGYDLLPGRVNVSATGAWAADTFLRTWGVEINGRAEAQLMPFVTLGLTGAGVLFTDQPVDPWAAYLDMTAVVF